MLNRGNNIRYTHVPGKILEHKKVKKNPAFTKSHTSPIKSQMLHPLNKIEKVSVIKNLFYSALF